MQGLQGWCWFWRACGERRAELSKGVKRHARASGISLVLNLEHVLDCLYAQAGRLPACSPRMQVAAVHVSRKGGRPLLLAPFGCKQCV